MTDNHKKKLIEVALPLEAINRASAKEKSIRFGHPSTMHLWWARRPLAACRAVLFAQLVDDPSAVPEKFPTEEDQERERARLFKIIEELVLWENSNNDEVLGEARAEIEKSCGGRLPPIYDPFSGGCSIPLEAQRLGLPAYGSDLNPVAVLIGKAMIELPNRFAGMSPVHPGAGERISYRNSEGLAEDVKYYGDRLREEAFSKLAHLYPPIELPDEYGGGEGKVVALIWARTVPSPDPAFSDVQVPLVSSFVLSTKKGKEACIQPKVDRASKSVTFEVVKSPTKAEIEVAKKGTKVGRGANFRCLLSDTAITPDYVKTQGIQKGFGHQLICVVALAGKTRVFLQPDETQIASADIEFPSDAPQLALPNHPQYVGVGGYGYETFADLFTARQLTAIETYISLLPSVREQIRSDAIRAGVDDNQTPLSDSGLGAKAYSEAVTVYLALGVSRLADIQNSLCMWESSKTQVRHLFTRHAIPMLWDYAECGLFSESAGDFKTSLGSIVRVLDRLGIGSEGVMSQADAQSVSYPEGAVVSCDPPYYDNVPYSDVSDFFYVWLRRMLGDIYPSVFGTLSAPKAEELVADRVRHEGATNADAFFLSGMTAAISSMAEQCSDEAPAVIFYAFKQSEIEEEGVSSTGWATFLDSVISAGYSVVGTWPMRTELANRMRGLGANALANSVVLVCRKRHIEAETVTRAEFIRALKRELPPALHELQLANITPVDMPQASIGPGIGIFSRYRTVLEADDSPMTVKTALQIINHELDAFLNEQEGEFDADTRFAVSWFGQNGMLAGDFGDADNLARARGLSVESVKHAGIVESAAGKVRLLSRDELEANWSPSTDPHLTVWECTQYLIRALENAGEEAAARLLKQMSAEMADAARDLVYRLFDICDKKGKSKEATAYNALIAVWPDLTEQAAKMPDSDLTQEQTSMF